MIVSGIQRAPLTLLCAAGAGALLWFAGSHVDRTTTGGYWAAYGLVAAAGLVFGLAQLRGAGGHPPAMLFVFVALLVVAGWVIVGMQPGSTWSAAHVRSWSSDIGVDGVVRALGTWIGVLAFGLGAAFAAVAEPVGRRRPVAAPVLDRPAADEPTTAERREVESTDVATADDRTAVIARDEAP